MSAEHTHSIDTFFNSFAKIIFKESGSRDSDDWIRAEYDPETGHYRILFLLSKRIQTRVIKYGQKPNDGEPSNEKIYKGIALLADSVVLPDTDPQKEVLTQLQSIMDSQPSSILHCTPGQIILVKTNSGIGENIQIIGFASSQAATMHNRQFSKIILQNSPLLQHHAKLLITNSGALLEALPVNPIVVPEQDLQDPSKFSCWVLTEAQTAKIVRKLIPTFDPSVVFGDTETRKLAYVLQATLESMQYARWSVYESDERITPETQNSYQRTLTSLLEYVGEKQFIHTVKQIMLKQFDLLHTYNRNSVLAEFQLEKPHSDSSALSQETLVIANIVAPDATCLPKIATGYNRVVNILPLYGDPVFWNCLHTLSEHIFHELANYIQTIPSPMVIRSRFADTLIDPVAYIRDYFPESYAVLLAYEPSFVSIEPQGIIDQTYENNLERRRLRGR